MVPRLQEKYEQEILPALMESLGVKNRLAIPRLQKIIVNMGVGDAIAEHKNMESARCPSAASGCTSSSTA